MTPKLLVITLWAEEVQTCAHFYRDLVGLRLIDQHSDHPHFDLDGAYLVIRKTRSTSPRDREIDRFPIVAFSVDDLDAAAKRLSAHQVELPWGVESDTSGRWIMFYDPAGNLIELTQRNN